MACQRRLARLATIGPGTNHGCSVVFPPHEGVTDLQLDIDHEQKRVTIRYTRGGKSVEERWRISGRSSR